MGISLLHRRRLFAVLLVDWLGACDLLVCGDTLETCILTEHPAQAAGERTSTSSKSAGRSTRNHVPLPDPVFVHATRVTKFHAGTT
jgi:hypothetical protein